MHCASQSLSARSESMARRSASAGEILGPPRRLSCCLRFLRDVTTVKESSESNPWLDESLYLNFDVVPSESLLAIKYQTLCSVQRRIESGEMKKILVDVRSRE